MTTLLVASAQPRVGRSLIAAALAYRAARDGRPMTLARLEGDESAAPDAATFASLEHLRSPGVPVAAADIKRLDGDAIVEAPAGSAAALASDLGARVLAIADAAGEAIDAAGPQMAGTIITNVALSDMESTAKGEGVIAVLAEDRVLAAPSGVEIGQALKANWLRRGDGAPGIERVMIGTVASDAASPYFGGRERKCVITRYDKTDIQLAALLTDVELLVLTGGGAPSPYLLDRVEGTRDDLSVLVTDADTPDAMRMIEELYAHSRFDGQTKLDRAVAMLDEAGVDLFPA